MSIDSNNKPSGTSREEDCPSCERVTAHDVRIEIREGGTSYAEERGTMKYSRGPYRVTECAVCGHVEEERISAARPARADDES